MRDTVPIMDSHSHLIGNRHTELESVVLVEVLCRSVKINVVANCELQSDVKMTGMGPCRSSYHRSSIKYLIYMSSHGPFRIFLCCISIQLDIHCLWCDRKVVESCEYSVPRKKQATAQKAHHEVSSGKLPRG